MSAKPRLFVFTLAAILLVACPGGAIDTPLSDTAVREAYFIGQRHDNSLVQLLAKYAVSLPEPKSGPYIRSVTFFTPFALAALDSSQHPGPYSAQQAVRDHSGRPEIVRVTVAIALTGSYGPYLVPPVNANSNTPKPIAVRPSDFWKDFRVRAIQDDQTIIPTDASGHPENQCSRSGCTLTGATITFDYPAEAFSEGTVTIQIQPPEGDPVFVDFDPPSLR